MKPVVKLLLILPLCCSNNLPARADGIEYFEKHVRPLLVKRCYACHSRRSGKSEGGLLLDSRDGWIRGGDSGTALIPGDTAGSLLIRAIKRTDPDLAMPPDRPLAESAIAHLENWVRMGAPDPRDGSKLEPDTAADNPSDPIAGRKHWAFRPLKEVAVPAVKYGTWPRSAIDHFVLARLETRRLVPVVDADRVTLARRTYLQLIGLPPTPEQLARFLGDGRIDAYERLVDELLSSPQFGERWGRHWLDLARYADSNGLDENFLFREAWRYRNQVIESINADTPFDRFVLEQIAGDLLPFDSIEQRDRQRIAAGFLVVGPKVLLGNDNEQRRMDVADEQMDTIGRSILGLTLGCARCHDHKFDPVPTQDYYALAGILTSTQVMERRYMLGQQRLMEQLTGLGENGHTADDRYEQYWRERPQLQARQKQAMVGLELLKKGDTAGFESHAKDHTDAVAEQARMDDLPLEKRQAAQQQLLEKINQSLASPPPIPPRAMIPSDVDKPADESIRLAGEFDQKGDQIPRGFLKVLCHESVVIPADTSGRKQLAMWLTDTERGAGQLAARVLVNRVWKHLTGRGLVRTVDNFGRTGERPTHPELLDYLARDLIRSGWSLKSLVRKIVLSRTFQLSSLHVPDAHAVDPDNRLLWRAHRRRLDPESMRDAMLSAAGTLSLTPMKSTVWYLGDQATAVGDNKNRRRTDFPCRSVYLPVIRNDLPELFEVFDFADPHRTTGMRAETLVATQGLYLLNAESVLASSEAVARRLLAEHPGESAQADQARIGRMYQLILNTQPSQAERAAMAVVGDN